MNHLMKLLFIKIFLSKCLSELEKLDLLYLEGKHEDYLRQSRLLLHDLHSNQHLLSNEFPTVEFQFRDHLTAIRQSIDQQNTQKLRELGQILSTHLNNVYDAARWPYGKRIRRWSVLLLLIVILTLGAFAIKPLQQKYRNESAAEDMLKNENVYASRTISDLLNLKKALQQYFNDNRSYPNTSATWYGVVCPFGKSTADWIPGLAPKYIKTLPHDPRKYPKPVEQYMYQSNGKDFKLIAHYAIGIDSASHQHPELVDPRRPSWAIGVWSEGAKNW
jgi:hypothetical protein